MEMYEKSLRKITKQPNYCGLTVGMLKRTYLAHKASDGSVQTIREHSKKVAEISKEYAVEPMKEICHMMGLLHDVGKYQNSFQRRIAGEDIRVEHSICGAKEAMGPLAGNTPLGLMIALCVAGHHSGIPDCGNKSDISEASTLFGRLKRDTEDYSAYKDELSFPKLPADELIGMMSSLTTAPEIVESYAFLTRYAFSCLTDADTLDTMQATKTPIPAVLTADFSRCMELIEKRFEGFRPVTNLQKARSALQAQAYQNIQNDADIYLMEMPTGSGKTLASMKCALIRALKTGKKRIIYVIPYNSIIDQTAKEFEEMFGDAAQILRHQSSFSYEDMPDISEDSMRSYSFACENWNAQIIITTAVQFFETIYSNKRGKLRKLHNLADTVMVFDEAHLMPVEYLQPCLRGIAFITKYLNSEAIFLTATMPDYGALIKKYASPDARIADLIPDQSDFRYFKKTCFRHMGTVNDETVIKEARNHASSLIVVNSRKAARTLYGMCGGKKYHLSTYMAGVDREETISRIRTELDKLREDYPGYENVPDDRKVVVISTSLIEAGIDLDFCAAFRELNGLDNLLQTGGRCNREGKMATGNVYSFERTDAKRTDRVEQNILRRILKEYPDVSSTDAIHDYYETLMKCKADLIVKNSMGGICSSLQGIPFRTYAENMHLIDSKTVSVMIDRDKTSHLMIEDAKYTGVLPGRKIQKYCCTVYENELEDLLKQHAVEEIGGVHVLTASGYYDPHIGIKFEGDDIYY